MADAKVEGDMGAAGGGAAAPSCVDAQWGKMSADTLGTYAEGEERWTVVCGATNACCWLSSSESSRSRLFEAGLAAGIVRLPAVVRSVSRSLYRKKLVGVWCQFEKT